MSDADPFVELFSKGFDNQGWEWHGSESAAMEYASDHAERVVIKCGKREAAPFATVWKAQPLARFLTRGAGVIWQGRGLQGKHWEGS